MSVGIANHRVEDDKVDESKYIPGGHRRPPFPDQPCDFTDNGAAVRLILLLWLPSKRLAEIFLMQAAHGTSLSVDDTVVSLYEETRYVTDADDRRIGRYGSAFTISASFASLQGTRDDALPCCGVPCGMISRAPAHSPPIASSMEKSSLTPSPR